MPAQTFEQKTQDAVDAPKLTESEIEERSFDLNKLFAISMVRESAHPQFDGMGYIKYNETNEMADISFIAPKKNKFDTRVTSGITHEKDSTILSMLENFNFEAQVSVFYKEKELSDLSTSFTAWIRKARQLDNYDRKRPIHYRNLIVQGTAFASIKHVQSWVPKKVITNPEGSYTDLDGIQWEHVGMHLQFDGPSCNLVDGKKVFLEDFFQNDIGKQSGIYTVEYVSREIMESIWGFSPRWANVPKRTVPGIGSVGAMVTQGSIYSEWFFTEVDFNKVEVIEAQRPFENRYQIYINGVPMLAHSKTGGTFPLTAISPSGIAYIAKGDIDPMNLCAYSKGIPAKTKMDQALYDSLVRIAKIQFEQAAFPPAGNNSGRLLSPDIFMPTKLTRNLRKEDISNLIDTPGMSNNGFQFVQMIKEQIDSKSVSSLLEGTQPQTDMTLGQYLDTQKKQLLKLGGIFDAVIGWEKQISHLILMNLLYYGTRKTEDIPIKDTFENGTKGLRILRFKNPNVATSDSLHAEELKYQEEFGQDVRFTDMNPDMLRSMVNNPDYYFYYEIVPVDKNNDKMTQAMYISMITQAANLFGMDSMKVQNLKQRYAQVMGEPFDDLFLNDQELAVKQEAAQASMAAVNPGSPVAKDIAMPSGGAATINKSFM